MIATIATQNAKVSILGRGPAEQDLRVVIVNNDGVLVADGISLDELKTKDPTVPAIVTNALASATALSTQRSISGRSAVNPRVRRQAGRLPSSWALAARPSLTRSAVACAQRRPRSVRSHPAERAVARRLQLRFRLGGPRDQGRRHRRALPDSTRHREIDARGAHVVPGFIDAHVHLESSLLVPESFQQAVCPKERPPPSALPVRHDARPLPAAGHRRPRRRQGVAAPRGQGQPEHRRRGDHRPRAAQHRRRQGRGDRRLSQGTRQLQEPRAAGAGQGHRPEDRREEPRSHRARRKRGAGAPGTGRSLAAEPRRGLSRVAREVRPAVREGRPGEPAGTPGQGRKPPARAGRTGGRLFFSSCIPRTRPLGCRPTLRDMDPASERSRA